MDGFEKYREQLMRLLSGALDAVCLQELQALLVQIAGEMPLSALADTAPRDALRGYGRHELLTLDRAELALVVLQPGDRIGAHDHGHYESECIAGAVLVVEGTERNRFYELIDGATLRQYEVEDLAAGQVLVLSSTLIHSIENPFPVRTVSLHAYTHAQHDPRTRKRRY